MGSSSLPSSQGNPQEGWAARGGLGLALVRGSSSHRSQRGLSSANCPKGRPCLPKSQFVWLRSLLRICLHAASPSVGVFFLFQEEMGISCELLESDFLKCSVGFPFMRSKSKVRGRVGDFPGSPQPFPPASDSNSGLALRFPPAPDGPWSRGLSLSSKRRAPSVRDALWPYRFGKQHLVGRLRVLFSGTFHEPWSP